MATRDRGTHPARTRRSGPAGLTGLLVGSGLLVAAPATAADTWTTTTVATADSTTIDFRGTFDVAVEVDSASGSAPSDGYSTLYAREARARSWEPVATTSTVGGGFFDVEPRMTTTYKVVYHGHRAATSADDTFQRSESAPFTVGVARTITYPTGGFVLEGRVRPRYAAKKVTVRVSEEKDTGYTRFRTVVTDAKGRYRIKLPRRPGRWYWSVKVPGDTRYLATGYQWETWVSERS